MYKGKKISQKVSKGKTATKFHHLLLFQRPASTSTLAVPALSSYNLLKSSTDCFFKFNLFGVSILRSMTIGFGCCLDSKLGMRCRSPGLIVRGLGPGTGREVDFDGGRPVTGFMGVLGYTGRAKPVIVGTRFTEAGMLGRRNSVAEAGLRSEPVGDMALMGDACSLCEDDGTAGGALLGAVAYGDSSLIDNPGSLVSPGRAIPPCGWYTFLAFGSYVLVVVDVGAGADLSVSSTCAAVRVFLFGILKLAEKPETGLLLVCVFDRPEVEVEVELRVPDFSSETCSQRGGIVGTCSSLGLRGAKPSVVAA
jgi:hypothetical protein